MRNESFQEGMEITSFWDVWVKTWRLIVDHSQHDAGFYNDCHSSHAAVSTIPIFFQVVQQQDCLSIAELSARCYKLVHICVAVTKSFWKLKKDIERNLRNHLFPTKDMQLMRVIILLVCFFTNCPYSFKLRFEFQTCLAWFRSSYSCKLTCFIWYTTNLYWMRLEQVNSVLRSWWTWILYLKQWWIFVANNTVLFARVSQNISRREYTKLK